MSCTKEWVLKTCKDNTKSLIDRLLEIRGIISEDAKQEFLHPLEITLMHPNAFCDMPKAVERIVKAIIIMGRGLDFSIFFIRKISFLLL